MAIGAMRALKESGYKIPTDVSTIGFDNIEASSIIEPPLTTVSQPIYEMGKKAVDIITALINGETIEEKRYLLKTKLIERQSCTRI
jgi:DNA-binding LacI/PurR family transcriptional regulator